MRMDPCPLGCRGTSASPQSWIGLFSSVTILSYIAFHDWQGEWVSRRSNQREEIDQGFPKSGACRDLCSDIKRFHTSPTLP